MKTMTVSKAKANAWKVFSKYIRLRDTNNLGTGCYTCGAYYSIDRMQAGNFISGRHPTYLFDERQVHAQCKTCNIFKHGATLDYEEHLIKDYGKEAVEEMKAHRKDLKQFKVFELLEIEQKYKSKLKEYERGN